VPKGHKTKSSHDKHTPSCATVSPAALPLRQGQR
jgi:hypothetical protein